MRKDPITHYEEFWPYYLRLHSKKGTQWLHVIGLILGVFFFLLAIFKFSWSYLALAPVTGYGLAWLSHFMIEKNQPATWQYPWWSFISDFKMTALILLGKL